MAEQPMKVLVVSDVHGRVTPLRWLLKNKLPMPCSFGGRPV